MYDENLNYEKVLNFMEYAPANIFFKDTDCKYRFATELCSAVNGGKEHSIIGKTDLEIHKFSDLGQYYYEDDQKILATGQSSQYVSEFPLETGSLYYEIKKKPVYEDGRIIGIIGVVNDVTQKVELEKKLKELSYKDQLTGLYSRNYLEKLTQNYKGKDIFPATVIMGDCNFLKRVNDSLGHEYGDLLLQRVANTITETIPRKCIPIRFGGDEFLILCPNTNKSQASRLISEIKRCLQMKSDSILTLDVAFGSYTVENDELPFSGIFRFVDQAMYKEKRKSHKNEI